MIIIAPTQNAVKTAEELAERGFDIHVGSEGRYLRAYPTTIPVEVA